MSTTPSGAISMASINTALNYGSTSKITLDDSLVRKLQVATSGIAAGTPTSSGTSISMSSLRNKIGPDPYGTYETQYCSGSTLIQTFSNGSYGTYNTQTPNSPSCRATLSVTYSTNQTSISLTVSTISGYILGKSDLTVTINSGVIISSASSGVPAFYISGTSAGDTVTIINNGTIVGRGGTGGKGGGGSSQSPTAGGNGGPAISLGCSVTLTNNGTIGGGGGGGGGGAKYSGTNSIIALGGGGGGGAGYGTGGTTNGGSGSATGGGGGGSNNSVGGSGGGLGASGSGGGSYTYAFFTMVVTASGAGGGGPGAAIAKNGYTLTPSTPAGTIYGSVG